MDKTERARLKRLANDAVIATFGYDSRESQLAVALEGCVDEFDFIASECDHCKFCDVHGEVEDDEIPIDANEVIRIHSLLKTQMKAFRDYHVELSEKLAEWADTERFTEPLAEIIEETEGYLDELQAEVLP